ncbi:MAG: ribonuclease HII [Sphingobacteriales bacterium]|nr:MAG: ribonuclease HII [Sphingobacteriales bacterium]
MLPLFYQTNVPEAGIDEAGRGCLAGPVFAAAVILPADFNHPHLTDSKLLSEADRMILRPMIEAEAIAWAVASASAAEIDQVNILQATFLAMHRAVDQLSVRPELLLIDGNRFKPYFGIAHQCFVKGDSRFAAIAAASILAKTHRDAYMHTLSGMHPQYGFSQHKGYPTRTHRAAIAEHGRCDEHRKTFRSA